MLDWHQINMSTKFTPYVNQNTISSGMVNQVLDCSCKGLYMTYGKKTPGGAKGKHCPGAIGSTACGCKSVMKMEKYPALSKIKINGIKYTYVEPVASVQNRFQHNHELSNHTKSSTLQKSKVIHA